MTANELAQLLFKRWNGDDVEIPPNLDDLCSEMLQKQQAEIEALKKARCVACGWNPNLIGGDK